MISRLIVQIKKNWLWLITGGEIQNYYCCLMWCRPPFVILQGIHLESAKDVNVVTIILFDV